MKLSYLLGRSAHCLAGADVCHTDESDELARFSLKVELHPKKRKRTLAYIAGVIFL